MNESFERYSDEELEQETDVLKIKALNDCFRQTFTGGRILITPGVQGLAEPIAREALIAIQDFSDFSEDNDPYGTHEFGEVNVSGVRVWFKIDAYDQSLEWGSPDPSDPAVTTRVMTIYLPEEH